MKLSYGRSYLAWAMLTFFYFYQYILRVSPGVMMPELRHAYRLTADEFATLGSYYLYAYSLMQIPLGILVDRIGLRWTALGSITLCLIGGGLFAIAPSLGILQIARILIGIGSASAFMSALKLATDSLPENRRGLMIGLTLTFGTMGAYFSGHLFVWILEQSTWQQAILWVTGLGGVVWLCVWLCVPHNHHHHLQDIQTTSQSIGQQFFSIIKNRSILAYSILAIGCYAPLSVLADLWGTAFLMEKMSISRASAAPLSMMLYVGLAMGSFLLPWLSDVFGNLNQILRLSLFGLCLTFAILLYGSLTWVTLLMVLLVIGCLCGSEMLCFTAASFHSNRENSGLIISTVNVLNMLGSAVLQQLVGTALDFQWDGTLDAHGVRVYFTEQYVYALTILLGVVVLCFVLSLMLKNEKKSLINAQ
ncbi:MAG TPA: MFS transporter [Candidatus Nitrosotenuis sp.]|jgi:MFS family permease|nr:MFS transporter [Candidatus Nitrosotenuis sp.]